MRKRKRRGMFRRGGRKRKAEGMYVHTVKKVNVNVTILVKSNVK